MFSSGAVKLRSGDPTWRSLTALRYHYETQPLPNLVSWYAHGLPRPVHRASVLLMLVIELATPFLLFAPQPVSLVGAGATVFLMLLIQVTGNYGFFNLLSVALVALVPDDAFYAAWIAPAAQIVAAPWGFQLLVVAAAVPIVCLSADALLRVLGLRGIVWPRGLGAVLGRLVPFRLVSSYGLFAVMTTARSEIVVEGSRDGADWREYELRWKPGDPRRAPRFCAPHLPRLDWQMWFAALRSRPEPWLLGFLDRLRLGEREVLRLLRRAPFGAEPPRFVRALVYDYRFTSRAERRATGAWWKRELVGTLAAAEEER
jgi:hypothetical protein